MRFLPAFLPTFLPPKLRLIVITKFQQNGSQLISLKRDDALRPLYSKIGVALEKVAKAEGYTQVLQTDVVVVYLDSNYDLTLKVLKELGIEVKEGE